MIAYLKGPVKLTDSEALIVNLHGLGYEVLVSEQTLTQVSEGEIAEFWIYTHVREDQLALFGFLSQAEKQLFLSLIKVNGIGPKVALKILGAAPTAQIIALIDQGDVQGLTKLPKVGKKTAETIVLELRGKLVLLEEEKRKQAFAARSDIVSALVNLGYRMADVEKAVHEMSPETDLQEGVRRGLQLLSSP